MLIFLDAASVPPLLVFVMAVTSVSHVRTRTGTKHINDRKCKWCCNINPDYNGYNAPYHYIELTAATPDDGILFLDISHLLCLLFCSTSYK